MCRVVILITCGVISCSILIELSLATRHFTRYYRPPLHTIIHLHTLQNSGPPASCSLLPPHGTLSSVPSAYSSAPITKLSLGNFMIWLAWFPLSVLFYAALQNSYLTERVDFFDEDRITAIHFLFEKAIQFGRTDELFRHDNLSMLLFGLIMFFENIGLLHVLFTHGLFSIEDKLFFRFLILEYWKIG